MKKKIALIMTVCMLSVIPTGCGSNATESDNEGKKVSSEQTNETNDISKESASDITTNDTSEDKETITKLTIVASAESDFTWYECEESDAMLPKGGVIISGYVGNDTEVVIPKSIDGKAVVAIDEYAFSPYTEYEREGSDGDDYYNFFEDCLGLDSSSDENIDAYMENHNEKSKITSVYIPNSVKLIGKDAFFFCDSLKTVTVYSDDEVDMDTSIGVGYECFAYCNKLEYVNGNFSAYRDYENADLYYGCKALKEVKLSSNQGDENGEFSWDWNMRGDFPNFEKVIIADGTKKITGGVSQAAHMDGMRRFQGDSLSIIEIYIPSSVEEIDIGLFINEDSEQVTELSRVKYEELGTDDYSLEDLEVTFNQNITIITPTGSYAEEFAKEYGIPYKNE